MTVLSLAPAPDAAVPARGFASSHAWARGPAATINARVSGTQFECSDCGARLFLLDGAPSFSSAARDAGLQDLCPWASGRAAGEKAAARAPDGRGASGLAPALAAALAPVPTPAPAPTPAGDITPWDDGPGFATLTPELAAALASAAAPEEETRGSPDGAGGHSPTGDSPTPADEERGESSSEGAEDAFSEFAEFLLHPPADATAAAAATAGVNPARASGPAPRLTRSSRRGRS